MDLRRFLALLASAPLASAQCVDEFIGSQIQSSDRFGYAVAMDGPRAAVGAPLGPGGVASAGAVYVYERSGPDWQERQRVFAPQVAYNERFGEAVDLDGGVLVAGAPYHDVLAPDDGAAYVFELAGSTWVLSAELSPAGLGGSALFGSAVAVEGLRAVVGAYNHMPGTGGSGALWVFERGASGWVEVQKLVPPSNISMLGSAVAMSGDRIVAGTLSGRAVVFERQGGSWVTSAVLAPPVPGYGRFGHAVALQGERALIGSPEWNVPGAAFVFELVAGTWHPRAQLEARDGVFYTAGFGYSVALDASRALVSAPFRHIGPLQDMGTAYLFQEHDGVWRHSFQLFDPTQFDEFSNFGWTVAIQGPAMLVGVPLDTYSGDNSGSAVAFTLPDSAMTTCFCYGVPPCGNVEPMTGCRNSSGVGALLAPCGTDSATLDDLVLTTTGLPPGQPALLFAGTNEIALPFGDGRLCAGGTVVRVELQNANAGGRAVYGPGFAAQEGFAAGEVRHFQVWYRDPQGPCGSGFNTSSGLLLRYAP